MVELLCKGSDFRGVGDGLVSLDLSGGGGGVSDTAMESVAKHCENSITNLNVSFCHKITDKGLGFAVDKCREMKSLTVWGLQQLTDDFFDGHARVGDSTLEIVGVWMKKSSGGISANQN